MEDKLVDLVVQQVMNKFSAANGAELRPRRRMPANPVITLV